ncbi:hypothetical protein DEIPH_ctg045orf0006 [Deinococcus phoenicis]|uniref:Uncharacterized protein n=1 Tax=Deinococcus phoenicis TaxID=1476583 RepID=A0A016QN11_9DEIO|nr:hypothetical protein [Deinococcus phoenicis]EYB67277.1 hypothetical protein DEIPH_ctg045orf0006 [Deinococcus phoenicis]
MTLVHVPLLRSGAVLSGDARHRFAQARAVQILNADAVILRARRVALRGLPEVATLPCGCHHDRLCPEAANLYQGLAHSGGQQWKPYAADFVEHRRALAPRAISIRPRLTAEGLWHAAQALTPQEAPAHADR